MRHLTMTVLAFATAAALSSTAIAAPLSHLPAPSTNGYQAAATMEMTVQVANANLREKPTTSAKILAKVPQGTKVAVTEVVDSGKWAHVTFNNLDGYIAIKSLK